MMVCSRCGEPLVPQNWEGKCPKCGLDQSDALVHYVDTSAVGITHPVEAGAKWTVVQENVTCRICLEAIKRPAQTIDGVTLTPGDRILIRQGPFRWGVWVRFVVRRPWRARRAYRAWRGHKQNGIYQVVASSTWERP